MEDVGPAFPPRGSSARVSRQLSGTTFLRALLAQADSVARWLVISLGGARQLLLRPHVAPIAYTSICFAPFVRSLVLSALTRIVHSRQLGGRLSLESCRMNMKTFPLALSKKLEGEGERFAGRRS